MKQIDTLFKFYEPNELINIDGDRFSHFGWEGIESFAFFMYAESYKRAGELLYKKMKEGNNGDRDALIYPLCFNYRHCMEMLLKFLYIKFSKENEEGIKEFLNKNHDLNKIWNMLNPILKINTDKVGTRIDINFIKNCVNEMNGFDQGSMRMRYPITKKLEPTNKIELRLDFHNFHDQMVIFYESICQLDSDISNQVRYQGTKEENELFVKKYNLAKREIMGFLNIIRPYVGNSIKKEINFKNLFNGDDEYVIIEEYLDSLTSDHKIVIEVLFYAGRAVNSEEVRLSKTSNMKVRDFINFCLYHMKNFGLEFGKEIPYMNTSSKQLEDIIRNIETAMSIIDLCDNHDFASDN
jgi:hypothetical protein